MPTQVEIPDVGTVEFPDSMTDSEIASTIKTKFPSPKHSEEEQQKRALDVGIDIGIQGTNRLTDILSNPAAGEAAQAGREQSAAEKEPLTFATPRQPATGEASTTYGGPPKRVASAAETTSEVSEELMNPRMTAGRFKINSSDNPAIAGGKEIVNIALGVPEFFTSTAGVGGVVAGAYAPIATAGAFTADMLHSLYQQAHASYKNWDKMDRNQKVVAVTDMVGTGVFAGLLGRGIYRGIKSKIEPKKAADAQLQQAAAQAAPVAPMTAAAVAGQPEALETAPKPEEPPKTPQEPSGGITTPVTLETPQQQAAVASDTRSSEQAAAQSVDAAAERHARGPEQITGASYTHPETGESTVGANHIEAAAQQGVEAPRKPQDRHGDEYGYEVQNPQTGATRYVSRDEGLEIARKSGQLLNEPTLDKLHSNEIWHAIPFEKRERLKALGLSDTDISDLESGRERVEDIVGKTHAGTDFDERTQQIEDILNEERKPNAVHREASPPVRDVQQPEGQKESQREVPADEAVKEAGEGGGKVPQAPVELTDEEKAAVGETGALGPKQIKKRFGEVTSMESMKADKLAGVNIWTDADHTIVEIGNPQDIWRGGERPEGLVNSTIGVNGMTGKLRLKDSTWGEGVDKQEVIDQLKQAGLEEEPAPKVKTKQPRAERLPDIIDELKDAFPQGINITSKGDYGNLVRGATGRAAKLLFIDKPGAEPVDTVIKALELKGNYKFGSQDELIDAVLNAGESLKGTRSGKTAVVEATTTGEAQLEDFQKIALNNKGRNAVEKKKTKPVEVSELKVGSKFTLKGEEFTVTGIDPDGFVRVEDGRRFGEQDLQDGTMFYPDTGSLEHPEAEGTMPADEWDVSEPPPSTPITPEAEKPPTWQQELLDTMAEVRSKIETREEVSGAVAQVREQIVKRDFDTAKSIWESLRDEKDPAKAMALWNEAKARSKGLAKELTKEQRFELFDLMHEGGDAAKKAWVQMNLDAVPEGTQAVKMRSTENPERYQIISRSTYPGHEGEWQVTRFDKQGAVGHFNAKSLDEAIREMSGEWIKGPPEGSIGDWKVEKTSKIEPKAVEPAAPAAAPPAPKDQQRPLTKAEQAEFQDLSIKARRAREEGGEQLNTEETQRYEHLTALAGQMDLLGEDVASGARSRVKQLREKADQMDTLRERTQERAYESKHRRFELFKEARTYDAAAKEARDEADVLERGLPEYQEKLDKARADRAKKRQDEEAAHAAGAGTDLFSQASESGKPKETPPAKEEPTLNEKVGEQSPEAAAEPSEPTTPEPKFVLKTEAGRTDGVISGEGGEITVRGATSENSDGTHSVGSLTAFVPPGILDPRIAPRVTIDLAEKVTSATPQEARTKAYQALTDEINKGNFDLFKQGKEQKQFTEPTVATTDTPGNEPQGAPSDAPKQRGKVRIKNSGPQTYTVTEHLPATEIEIANGEQPVRVKNDKTGAEQVVMEADLQEVRERTPEERQASKGMTKKELDDELRKHGLEPSSFKSSKEKREALKRERLKGPGSPSLLQGPDPQSQIKQLADSFKNIKGAKPSWRQQVKEAFALGERIAAAKDIVSKSLSGLKSAGDFIIHEWKGGTIVDEMLRAKGELSGALEQRGWETRQFAKNAMKGIPSKAERAAVLKWVDAGGSTSELLWGANHTKPEYRQSYIDAMHLTGDHRVAAENIKNFFEARLQEAIDAGVLEHGIDDYIHRIYEKDPQAAKQISAYVQGGLLSKNPALAKKRVFQMDWEAERLGYKPVQDFLPRITTYETSLSKAIAAREFIRKVIGHTDENGNKIPGMKAKDGRPIIDVAGLGVPVEDQAGVRDATLINPSYKPTDTKNPLNERSDYKERPEFSALKKWKWATEDAGGKPIYVQGNVLVHPDFAYRVDALLKPSALRYSESPKVRALSRAALGVSGTVKQSMLDFSAFHPVQIAVHGAEHRVNPLNLVQDIDFTHPDTQGLLKGGLTIGGDYFENYASEGLGGKSLSRLIPWLGPKMETYHNWMFQDFIPRVKMTMAEHALERNRERFKGQLSDEEIYRKTANEANAAFGGLNRITIERSKTAQDLARIILLAPDFLEARARFVGQAFKRGAGDMKTAEYWKKGGPLTSNEQRQALLLGAATMYSLARVANYVISGQAHTEPENAFSVVYKGKAYGLRTVQGDVLHALEQPVQFWMSRLNPVFGRTLLEMATGRDYFGRKRSALDQLWDAVSTVMPVSLRTGTERKLWESLLNGMGVTARRYSDADQTYKMAQKWKEKNGVKSRGEFIYDSTKDPMRPLKVALSNGDEAGSVKTLKKLIDSGEYTVEKLHDYFSKYATMPFTGSFENDNKFFSSLSNDDKKTFTAAKQHKLAIRELFLESLSKYSQASEEKKRIQPPQREKGGANDARNVPN